MLISKVCHVAKQQVTGAIQVGFTLIEVMVTVAIVAILASIALPSYNEYIVRGRIPEATTALADLRVKLEQYYQDNRTYVGACAADTVAPLPTGQYFDFTCPTLSATAFTIQATGKSGTSVASFTFTLDQSNTRKTTAVPSGWGTAPIACWVVRKGGGCS